MNQTQGLVVILLLLALVMIGLIAVGHLRHIGNQLERQDNAEERPAR